MTDLNQVQRWPVASDTGPRNPISVSFARHRAPLGILRQTQKARVRRSEGLFHFLPHTRSLTYAQTAPLWLRPDSTPHRCKLLLIQTDHSTPVMKTTKALVALIIAAM